MKHIFSDKIIIAKFDLTVKNVFDRWCKLLRCTKVASIVVMVLNGVSNTEMQKYPDSFPTLRNQFQTVSIKSLSTSKYTI